MSFFQPLEVVGRGSETQLQVAEKINYLLKNSIIANMYTPCIYLFKYILINIYIIIIYRFKG